jgi:hypothetical protein
MTPQHVCRGIAILAGMVALFFAYPGLPLVVLVAVLAAFPRTWAPAGLMAVIAVLWLVETEVHPSYLTLPRLCAVALALYYLHLASALAAALPDDARIDRRIFRPVVRRAGIVTGLTLALAALVAAMELLLGTVAVGWGIRVVELVCGFAIVIGAAILLTYLGRRTSAAAPDLGDERVR